jgi:hypothetical protein
LASRTQKLSLASSTHQGGVGVLVGVQDTGRPLKAYSDDKDNYFGTNGKIFHPPKCKTKLDHINYHFRQDGEHKYAWNFETLKNALEDIGFRNCSRRDFDPALDSESRIRGTLYVDCVRP